MSFSLDITFALSEKIGPQGGVSKQSINALNGEFLEVHEQFVLANAEFLLPHMIPIEHKKTLIDQFRTLIQAFEGEIVFVGERGNLSSLKAHLQNSSSYHWLEDVSPETIQHIFKTEGEILLFVLDGPPWVRVLAEELISSVSRMIICVGDGSKHDGWQIEGAEIISCAGACDVRFAAFSALGLALLIEDGSDELELSKAYERSRELASKEGMRDNPSYMLASIFAALEKERNPLRPVLMLSNSTWSRWAQWATSVWMGITAQVSEKDGVRRRFGSEATIASICDEGMIQQLLSSPREQITILCSSDAPRLTSPSPLTSRAWNVQNNLLDAFADLMARESRPVCELRLKSTDSLELFETSFFWVHSALALAGIWVDDPLLLDGADRYRRSVSKMLLANT
jgi:hypothetical protein